MPLPGLSAGLGCHEVYGTKLVLIASPVQLPRYRVHVSCLVTLVAAVSEPLILHSVAQHFTPTQRTPRTYLWGLLGEKTVESAHRAE